MSRYLRSTLQVLIAIVFMFGAFGTSPARPVEAASTNVVISEVYGGGGNSGAPYKNDFIELINLGTAPVDLTGWSVQYASGAGTSWQVTPLSGDIPVGGYYLIQEAGGAIGSVLPTPDVTGTINLSGTAGKVALVSNHIALSGTVTLPNQVIVDFVGFGITASLFEGSGPTPAPSNTKSVQRTSVCTDGDSNNTEFVASAPVPQNSSSTLTICDPDLLRLSTIPTSRSNGVALNADITLNFTKSVLPAGDWYSLTCTISGVHAAVITPEGTSTTITLNPGTDFVNAEACTLAIKGSMLTPAMTYNPIIRFSTISLGDGEMCGQPYTPINAIQGVGSYSPYTGLKLATEGVVTADLQTTKNGFYIQDHVGDNNPLTSEGMFIYTSSTTYTVPLGALVRVTGTVTEFGGLTEMTGPFPRLLNCGASGVTIPPVELSLPFANTGAANLEPLENMLVRFAQALVINEYYNFDRYGEIILSSKRLDTPTNVVAPGAAAITLQAANDLNKITLDDGFSTENPSILPHPNGGRFCHGSLVTSGSTVGCTAINIFRGGDTVANLTVVVDDESRGWKFVKTQPANYFAANPRLAAPDLLPGELRISSINTLNYFITLTSAGKVCGPSGGQDCRGADNATELTRQRAKTVAAVTGMASDVTGLLELENDRPLTSGLGADYAILDIVAGLNDAVGAGTYAFIATGPIGTDAIKAGIVYKPARVTPVGTFALLDGTTAPEGTVFVDTCNRPVLAQTFRDNATQQLFTVAINHLKSKGSACDLTPGDKTTGVDPLDLDTGDGQGASNYTRTQAAMAQVRWLETDPTGTGSQMYLIIGDLNSYAMEDPITAIKNGADGLAGSADDYFDLVQRFRDLFRYPPSYGYVYGAQAGYLDGALANRLMASYVLDAKEWHINADEADVLDYNTNFKGTAQQALYNPDPYRSSDHDPILVSLMLNHDPAPVDDTYTTAKNKVLVISKAEGVLANDTDANIYDTVRAGLATPPTYGQVTLQPDGSFIYTPAPDFVGVDTFEYTMYATPGLMGAYSNNAKVTITVTENVPFVGDKHYEAVRGFELKVGVGKGLLENAVTEPNRTLTAILVLAPAHGTLILLPDGSFSYISDPNFIGDDEFLYKITGGVIESPVYVGTIHVKEFFTYYLPIIAK